MTPNAMRTVLATAQEPSAPTPLVVSKKGTCSLDLLSGSLEHAQADVGSQEV